MRLANVEVKQEDGGPTAYGVVIDSEDDPIPFVVTPDSIRLELKDINWIEIDGSGFIDDLLYIQGHLRLVEPF